MEAKAKITDQCLWLKHIEDGPVKAALSSLHPGATIRLLVDGEPIDFQRMATGVDGRITAGFNPVGPGTTVWRNRYVAGEHEGIVLGFAHFNG